MSQTAITTIKFSDKLRIWLFAIYYAVTLCFKNTLLSVWKTSTTENLNELSPYSSQRWNGNHMFVKIKNVKLHYVECGSEDSPLLLLIHGFLDCWLGWRHQIKVLSQSYRVVAVDLKGFGDSEKPQWRGSYTVETLVSELVDLIDSLGVERCTVIGHDIGALLSWFLVAEHPRRIDKFISIASPHPNVFWDHLPSADGFNSKFVHLCQVPYLPESEIRKDNMVSLNKIYKHLRKSNEIDILNGYKYIFSRYQDIAGPIHYLRNLPFKRLTANKIIVPTLLILGNQDPFVSVEALVRSTQFLVDFQMKMIDETGHFPHQENFLEVNSALHAFLKGIPENCAEEREKETQKGLIESLVTNTFKYGNSIVDNVKKSTNNVVWKPQLLKSSG